jgi:hypothetical protein
MAELGILVWSFFVFVLHMILLSLNCCVIKLSHIVILKEFISLRGEIDYILDHTPLNNSANPNPNCFNMSSNALCFFVCIPGGYEQHVVQPGYRTRSSGRN